jgi:hypothetical protein
MLSTKIATINARMVKSAAMDFPGFARLDPGSS